MRHLAVVSLLLLPVFAACATTPPEPLPDPMLEGSAVDDYDAVRPSEVLVLPVEQTSGVDAPLAAVRQGLYQALIGRRYAPFRLDLDPAAVPPSPAKGELLARLELWDRSRAEREGFILASGEAWLTRAGRRVWQGSFANLRLRCRRSADEPTRAEDRDRLAARALGLAVLRTLPIKGD